MFAFFRRQVDGELLKLNKDRRLGRIYLDFWGLVGDGFFFSVLTFGMLFLAPLGGGGFAFGAFSLGRCFRHAGSLLVCVHCYPPRLLGKR